MKGGRDGEVGNGGIAELVDYSVPPACSALLDGIKQARLSHEII